MSLENAQKSVNAENRTAPIVKCQQWEYATDVGKSKIRFIYLGDEKYHCN